MRTMRATRDGRRAVLHDDAFRYAFRRSLSVRLASAAALEAVGVLDIEPDTVPGTEPATAADVVPVLLAARAALERYVPPDLPPRVPSTSPLYGALAALSPGEREFLLLLHWDGLSAGDAARAAGQDVCQLPAVEARCAGMLSVGSAPDVALPAVLAAVDPARTLPDRELEHSRSSLHGAAVTGESRPVGRPIPVDRPDGGPMPVADGRGPVRRRRIQTVVGAVCLVLVVAALAVALVPRTAPGPAGRAERLFGLADVVAVIAATSVEPTVVDGEMRILQRAPVVQIVKGEADPDVLTLDVTGRSTLERPYSRNFFPPHQLVFLVRDASGVLSPVEGDGSVLTLADRRTGEATTIAGDPAVLPDELRDAIDAMPEDELPLATSGAAPGSLDPESIVGIRPAEGRDAQNLPQSLLGTFRAGTRAGGACVWFEFNGRSVLIRWPDGFSAYLREPSRASADRDPEAERRVLTVLNERGYPYVDEYRSAPFIRGVPTGGRGVCGGQDLEVWDIAVAPGSTLLFY
ncbi:hypothetical protein CVO76_02205 [Arthrobacter agilis]|uniref:Uncharacterized protein n=1 Tax=Arthrobacter agilis TaxID=37921 RepID=A0A2L0UBH2_9MICC|nr:hypothetical protein CVO76_02205 [Arthrobacter agilis]